MSNNAPDRKYLLEKWGPVLDHEGLPAIGDRHRREVTAILLENQQKALMEENSQVLMETPPNIQGGMPDTGGVAKYDPVLIGLVRRATPLMIAYDVCGVQPMTGPTGLIFAMKSRYDSQTGDEALFNEADTAHAGTGTHEGSNPVDGTYTTGEGRDTESAEVLGGPESTDPQWNQMAFSIEKTSVVAKTRALKTEYTIELAQDLKAVHGLDADAELAAILTTEILAEINREVIRTVYTTAKPGASLATTPGTYDLDADSSGRWAAEKFKELMFQIERDANVIAQQTRRGKGNFIICSSDVASALHFAGKLDLVPALEKNNLNVDEASTTFAGVLNNRYKVYVDPYSANNSASQYYVVGYKGTSPFDAGMFYCPYVPLQQFRAVDENTFQPKMGFKTRYGMVSNPFVHHDGSGNLVANENYYYRRVKVSNIV